VTRASTTAEETTGARPALQRPVVVTMAAATGLSVASNYYAQPLLPLIGHDLHLSAGTAGLLVTVTQLGYAAGLVLLLPLGDLLERRRLTVVLSLLLAAGLLVIAAAPGAAVLFPAAVAVGALSVLAQILVPLAATLADDTSRGRVVGAVMSGLLLGILLARTVAGALAATGTWRAIYAVAAVLVVGQAVALQRVLPVAPSQARLRYGALLRSVPRLMRDEPVLRLRSALGGLSFGAFSVLWTSMAFLLAAPPYGYGPAVIGLFGLAGAAGALAASTAGRLADRGRGGTVTLVSTVLLAACWLPIWAGRDGLAGLVVGVVVLDLAVQGVHITNQSEIFRLAPEVRSRVNSAYMTTYFAGGAAGSAASAYAYSAWQWSGVCAVGAAFGAAAALVWTASLVRARMSPPG
jgi:predicted MFS family arabinose efflux permease